MNEYDNTNQGAVFPASNEKLIRSGKLNIEGIEERVTIVQVTTKTGKTVFEVYKKVGAVFINDNKRDEKDADMSGTVNFGNPKGDYMMWGRKRESKGGVPFTSLTIAPKGDGAKGSTSPSEKVDDEEIPF